MEPGTVIDRYRVLRHVGDGGMASVWLAEHTILGSKHALKILRPELAAHATLRDRFLAEGRIAAQVRHPHIVDVTDVLIGDGVAGLVMEYVAGDPLDVALAARAVPMDTADLCDLFLPIADALAEAHAFGVVHRDLKPANVLLGHNRRGKLRPVVLDFGIAKLEPNTRVAHTTRRPTEVGTRMGTPAYMSPEQVRSADAVDARTDLFSLGAMLYEAATGSPAFPQDSDFDAMQAIVDGRWRPARDVNPAIDPGVDAIITVCLAALPGDRFPSADALAAALAGTLRQGPRPTPAPPAATPEPLAQPTRPAPDPAWHGPWLLVGDTRWPLRTPEVAIGSASDNEVVLPHPSVSAHHCVLRRAGGAWTVHDLRSDIGTLVDQRMILGRQPVAHGAVITVGAVDTTLLER